MIGLRYFIVAAAFWGHFGIQPAQATIWSLVIGIDDYDHISDLRGAVNDALDIYDALSALPDTRVVRLLNEEATRERIFSEWRAMAAQAQPGDRIVVTFAGHGASEPAFYPETEDDGRDETLLLSGFSSAGPSAEHRIRDDEIAELIDLRPDIPVIFVADSCHSGTATRATDFDLTYRFFPHGNILDDPLPPPPPPAQSGDPSAAENAVYFGAVADDELAPELPIDGQIRGALSYAFAAALRGSADEDGNGAVSKGELETYIRRFVQQATASRQRPRVFPLGQQSVELFRLSDEATEAPPAPAFSRPFDELPPVTIRSTGPEDAEELFRILDGIEVLQDASEDDLFTILVDLDARVLRTVNGDRIRRLFGQSDIAFRTQIQETVDVYRGMSMIARSQLTGDLEVWFPLGDELYFADEPVQLVVDGRRTNHLSVLNVPADGTVEFLYPYLAAFNPGGGRYDPEATQTIRAIDMDVIVFPPFGIDHVIAIETAEPVPALRRALNRHDGLNYFRDFWDELHIELEGQDYTVVVNAFFTRRNRTQ